jgi:DNA-binding Lrp family transcriptional regulator
MRDFDLQLYRLLVNDPRMPYRELASQMGVSTPVIYRYMQQECAAGRLSTVAVISASYLHATMVTISGQMDTKKPIEEVVDELRQDDSVIYVMLCSANMIYVSGLLRHKAEMDRFQEFVRDACQMRAPCLAVEALGRLGEVAPVQSVSSEEELSPLDLRIISSLHRDGRKTYDAIAKDVGASAKTARRHLDRMMTKGLIEIWVLGDPAPGRYLTTAIHVRANDGVDVNALGLDILHRFPDQVLTFRMYGNLPDTILVSASHETSSGLNKLLEKLVDDPRVCSVVPNIVFRVESFDTWREKMLPELEG